MNKITITGRLAADSELRFTASNDAILGFRVADDVGYGDKKSTNWWQCSVWGKRGETLQQYLTKGQQVAVFGQALLREYTDKDGQKRISTEVRVDEVQLMGGKNDSEAKPPASKQSASKLSQIDDSDVPF